MSKPKKHLKSSVYQVCFRPSVPGYGLQIHEIFYNDQGVILDYAKQPVSLQGDEIAELYQEMHRMWRAIEAEEPLDLDHLDKRNSLHSRKNGL